MSLLVAMKGMGTLSDTLFWDQFNNYAFNVGAGSRALAIYGVGSSMVHKLFQKAIGGLLLQLMKGASLQAPESIMVKLAAPAITSIFGIIIGKQAAEFVMGDADLTWKQIIQFTALELSELGALGALSFAYLKLMQGGGGYASLP